MAKKVGRKTDLTEELIKEIKQHILDGNNLKETATLIFENYPNLSKDEKKRGLNNYIQKLYNWNCDNYLKIGDKIEGWKRDRKINLATKNLEDILDMSEINIMNKDGKLVEMKDVGILRVKADMTKFTLETLAKDEYSKRNELSGPNGKDLPQPITYVQRDNSNNQDKETTE